MEIKAAVAESKGTPFAIGDVFEEVEKVVAASERGGAIKPILLIE